MAGVSAAAYAAGERQRLADDHGSTVAYPTLRTYVIKRRESAIDQ